MPTYIEPLNLKLIFINYFLGTTNLFYFVFVILFAFSCAKYQLPDKYFLLLLGIGSIMFGMYVGEGMLVVLLFLIGFISFKPLSTYFNKV